MLLGAALALAGHLARGPLAQWFWADTRQQLPGLSLALMALMAAMSWRGLEGMVGAQKRLAQHSDDVLTLQTALANQINLLVTAPGVTVQFWDGNQLVANTTALASSLKTAAAGLPSADAHIGGDLQQHMLAAGETVCDQRTQQRPHEPQDPAHPLPQRVIARV